MLEHIYQRMQVKFIHIWVSMEVITGEKSKQDHLSMRLQIKVESLPWLEMILSQVKFFIRLMKENHGENSLSLIHLSQWISLWLNSVMNQGSFCFMVPDNTKVRQLVWLELSISLSYLKKNAKDLIPLENLIVTMIGGILRISKERSVSLVQRFPTFARK